ncbi:hypothetical protein C8Q74DRAFT_1192313 [Fomes fomentarius]|nr:hypothetical protein C8Q74DRAFT_1192313 [Fomes fomentarius]
MSANHASRAAAASGRGAYYKQLYGGRGRGRGRGNANGHQNQWQNDLEGGTPDVRETKRFRSNEALRSSEDLLHIVRRLGGKNYPAYRDLQGSWQYPKFRLFVDHVQGDAYAPPSKLRLRAPHSVAQFPSSLFSNRIRYIAFCDYLTRHICEVVDSQSGASQHSGHSPRSGWAGEKGGQVTVDRPGQQVLERSSIVISGPSDAEDGEVDDGGIELRFCVSLPAQGRSILGENAYSIFSMVIPALAENLLSVSHDHDRLKQFIDSVEDQDVLRRHIMAAGLVAFVPNSAILPRASGASDKPMSSSKTVPFQSPPNLERTFVLPHRGAVTGMAIPRGITMIAGGGFHGKSTLLDALARGCYNHIPGDGREFLVTCPHIVSIQGEDGRAITNVDISPFITNLPGGVSTSSFSTQDASGSTSMAAGVIEAIELGADTLLFDEDTCATNFLIRDQRMQRLISADPITPLVHKVRAMFKDHGCSSVLVIGGCGDYCDVADLVLEMREYRCYDITAAAKQVAQEIPSAVMDHAGEFSIFGNVRARNFDPSSLPSPDAKLTTRRRTAIEIGHRESIETLDLSALVQLTHDSQTRAIAASLKHLNRIGQPQKLPLREYLARLEREIEERGLDAVVLRDRIDGFLAWPREIEVGMALNRLVCDDHVAESDWIALNCVAIYEQRTVSIVYE